MKSLLSLLAGVGIAWLSSSLPADSVEPIPLCYQFTPGQTNAYRVTFETVVNEQPTTLAGIVYVDVRRVEDGVAAVGLSGALLPKAMPGAGPWQGVFNPRMGGWFPRPIHLQPQSEVRVDELGQVVRQWTLGGANLPPPIGSVVTLFFEPMPGVVAAEWQSQAQVLIDDETPSTDPHGRHFPVYDPGRSGFQLLANRGYTARLVDVDESMATIKTRTELASLFRTGTTPRFEVRTEGTVIFDHQRGRLQSIEWQGQAVTTTITLTLRRPMKLTVQLLEGEALARALEELRPESPQPPPVITRGELETLLRDLKSSDPGARMTAFHRLQTAEVEEPTDELLATAVTLANSGDSNERLAAVRILAQHGTAKEVPVMVRLLAWAQPGTQRELMERLGRLKDPRAIDTLADVVARGSYEAEFAIQMLKGFGPAAETAGLELLQHRHVQTRRMACLLLGEVGTSRSLDPLREQMLDHDNQIAQTATEALRAVRQRVSVEPL
jgi:hypothetical protein